MRSLSLCLAAAAVCLAACGATRDPRADSADAARLRVFRDSVEIARGRWTLDTVTSPMGDPPTFRLMSSAVSDSSGAELAMLLVQCPKGKPPVVLFGSATPYARATTATGFQPTRVRFDSAAAESGEWAQTEVGSSMLVVPEPLRFIQRLRTAQRLLVEYTTVSAGTRIAAFSTGRFVPLVTQLQSACGWQ